ncbi:MAG: hypothetical protein K8U57_02165 [Planctomycetes bacterium]|nr:hypothetical protein [Planctomycetota bacterium]
MRLQEFTITTASPRRHTKAKFTAAGVLTLLNSARLPGLTAFDVSGPTAETFGAAEFFADAGLAKLTRLTLKVRVSLADVIACPRLAHLRKFRLDDTDLTEGDANSLLASPTFARLTNLTLWTRGPLPHGFEGKLRARFGDNLWLRSGVS